MIRILLLALCLGCLLGPAVTTGWTDIVTTTEHYTVDGTRYEGFFARNTQLGNMQPVVVLIHDWDGLGEYEQTRARMLARAGYAVFAVDLYGKGVRPQTLEAKRTRSGALYKDREEFRKRLFGSLAALDGLEGVDPGRVVVLGYCFGGAAVLELARAGADLQGGICFHGGLTTPEGQHYAELKGPLLILHGTEDAVAPMEDVLSLTRDLDTVDATFRIKLYSGTGHAFTEWSGDRYAATADLDSWQECLRFLEARLGNGTQR